MFYLKKFYIFVFENIMKNILLLFVLVYAFISCQQREKPIVKDEIIFDVDSNLIGNVQEFPEIGIKLSAPKNWNRVDLKPVENLLKNFEESKRSDGDTLSVLGIFADTITKCQLIVSLVKTQKDFNNFISNLDSTFSRSQLFKFQRGNFQKGVFKITQYLLQSDRLVVFRLFSQAKNQKIFQIDYVIPKTNYSKEIAKAVESSIGSLVSN